MSKHTHPAALGPTIPSSHPYPKGVVGTLLGSFKGNPTTTLQGVWSVCWLSSELNIFTSACHKWSFLSIP